VEPDPCFLAEEVGDIPISMMGFVVSREKCDSLILTADPVQLKRGKRGGTMRARVFIIAVRSDEMRRQTLGGPLHERRTGGFFLGKFPPQHFQKEKGS
jgi:hypothetical protein